MKKTYQNPEVSVVEIETRHCILSDSLTLSSETTTDVHGRELDFDDEE